ncbi:ThiF family adenylyltransferase [Microbacterium oleivorans]|uniref:ThiF family adenylyltransferase n=1 Tax=Microbacterium oleivorans TaxID=273677 RepID=A0A7D5IS97_9MICO|nr:ThiF family adenylyltransferase [Microbacterium oleivorans]QLD11154.1 ThiF family adenylyltransferase [Microbacterium oleivorans]
MAFPPLVDPAPRLSDTELRRTARHRVLAGLGDSGQRRLAAAHVGIVGVGGLGSPVILALAAAGVGTITVIDDDDVEHANLQRQVIHRIDDVGSPKVESAVRAVAALSPETRVVVRRERLDAGNAARLLDGCHLVIDGTDTFETRTVVAAACADRGLPLVWGVIQEFHAQVTVFWSAPPGGAPGIDLADLYPPGSAGELPTCAEVGVLGSLCMTVGGMLATEAIKLVTGIGEPLFGRLVVVDGLSGSQREVPLRPARGPRVTAPAGHGAASPAAGTAAEPAAPEVDLEGLRSAQRAGAIVVDVREPHETADGTLPGSVLVPLADLLARPEQIEAERVVVVCARGIRAHRAADALRSRGVDATVLAGGLAEWAG